MRLTLLLTTLVTLSFAGCISSDAPTEPALAPEKSSPNPVAIDENHDLTTGMSTTTWTFIIHPGATHSQVRFELLGPADTGAQYQVSRCFTAETPAGDVRSCSSGNVNVGAGFGGGLFEDHDAQPGAYRFTFSSLPGVGTLHAFADVRYS